MTGSNFGIPHPIGTGLPADQPFLLTNAASNFVDAHARITAAGEAFKAKVAKRETRLITVPGLIALATLLYCVIHGYIVSGVILAGMVGFGAFWILAVIPVVVGTPTDPTAGQLTAIGVEEVKRSVSLMNRGRYQWVGRGSDFIGVFPDTSFVYYFGPATRWRHMLLAGRQTVRQVRVNATTQASQTSTSTTRHGRRFAVAPSPNIAVLSKGKSTTTHQISTTSHTTHVLEIQYQKETGTAPAWLSVNFGTDGRLAEDWRLMIAQAAGLA
jgi:hypothetical protein